MFDAGVFLTSIAVAKAAQEANKNGIDSGNDFMIFQRRPKYLDTTMIDY
jgi:hypothetical protein